MKTILLTIIIVSILATPVLALDMTLGTDYDVDSEDITVIGEVSQDWQALTFGATIEENLKDLSNEEPGLNDINLWAEMQIDERLSIKAEKNVANINEDSPVIDTVKVRFNVNY